MSNNIFKNIIICIGAAAIVAATILMPGFFLKKISAQKYKPKFRHSITPARQRR